MSKRLPPSVVVTREEAGRQLDEWLAARFTYHTLTEWRDLVRSKQILVRGFAVAPDYRLKFDDDVRYLPPDLPEPPVCTDYTIVHDGEDYLVVNKPPDLPCHPGGRYFEHTLWHLMGGDGDRRLYFINRLDRETSGLLLIAQTRYAARKFGKQFQRRQVSKEYLCLVEGEFPEDCHAAGVLVEDPDSEVLKKRKYLPAGEGETCDTSFRLMGRGGGMSLLHCRLGTGRLHQIRVTLCSLGFPVVGDKVYGRDDNIFLRFIKQGLTDADRQLLRLPHQALHAWRLGFTDPHGVERLFEAPLPADVQDLLRQNGIAAP